jgi:prepilin-type N-terminal cleavage/methylation domain-containing protein
MLEPISNHKLTGRPGPAERDAVPPPAPTGRAVPTGAGFCKFLRKLRAGFSLMELLVVIVIIGILVALLFPALLRARENARRTAARTEMWEIQKAWTVFYRTYGRLPAYTEMTTAAVGLLAGDVTGYNPLGIKFMDFDRADFDHGMRDPWGRRYKLTLTADPDAITTKWTYQTRAFCQNVGRDYE